ncbi:aminotransferase class I/II-fold pyridoxal phosphate-dependent enzyme [Paraliobacillus salinarum]|uniref:aminotransferase class I/II-fold pyridoxal phosphate-dependent enzyme n=1 Tax=Paraliobacillus salinarum TaxID=1158996 RepID=UPI0015F5D8FB|nr:aminotransferase class I/II-fold pyridoxal phosphate-dependent enzyme [Paraliobacillus salinarum]
MDQKKTPLYDRLIQFKKHDPISFHVPGHKNGTVIPKQAEKLFNEMLSIDLTELTGLDDLHAPTDVIAEAQQLASEWFQSEQTFFLINGSTVGNLAMILASCGMDDKVIIQRNCHKSIWNGVELSGATPVMLAPAYDPHVNRYTIPIHSQIKQVIRQHADAKAIILTYPDYFGRTYDLREIINVAHEHQIAVLIDEAHGVHFSITHPFFPKSALELGADAVVQSAHKMAPAMTMTAFLHVNSSLIDKEIVATYLSMLQSSSPSYPLLASLDIARSYLATRTDSDMELLLTSVKQMRKTMESDLWDMIPVEPTIDDPLKITLQMKAGISAKKVAQLFESAFIFSELITDDQILFIHGLEPFKQWNKLENAKRKVEDQLKISEKHATIEQKVNFFPNKVGYLAITYQEMKALDEVFLKWDQAIGKVAAEHVVPYPPGIPILVKGERIEKAHIKSIQYLINNNINFQSKNIQEGVYVFK